MEDHNLKKILLLIDRFNTISNYINTHNIKNIQHILGGTILNSVDVPEQVAHIATIIFNIEVNDIDIEKIKCVFITNSELHDGYKKIWTSSITDKEILKRLKYKEYL